MHYLSVGQKLRVKRKELDLTLKEVAGEMISPATLSLVERDLQAPSEELLRYLADKLQTPFHYFRETPEDTLQRRAKSLLTESEALMYRKRFGISARFAEEILLDAKDLRLNELIAQSSFLLGRIYVAQEDYHTANQYLFEAQSAALLSGHHELLPNIFYHFGLVSFRQGFFSQALDYFKQAEGAEHATVDDSLGQKILSMLSQCYHKLGHYDLALDYAKQAKEMVSRMNDIEAYAESLLILGASHREKEQYDLALEFFQEALRLIRQSDARHEQSNVEHSLASLYVKTGELDKAHHHFDVAIDQKRQLADASVVTTCLDHVEMLIESGEYEAALSRLNMSIELLTQYEAEEEQARALALRYQLAHLAGNEQAERPSLEASLSIIRRRPVPKRLADHLVKIGRLCASSGDQAMATLLFTEALAVYEQLGVILGNIGSIV
jgi:HTH-type transcriptional regulator, quorum sensing regulator NprR